MSRVWVSYLVCLEPVTGTNTSATVNLSLPNYTLLLPLPSKHTAHNRTKSNRHVLCKAINHNTILINCMFIVIRYDVRIWDVQYTDTKSFAPLFLKTKKHGASTIQHAQVVTMETKMSWIKHIKMNYTQSCCYRKLN